ncbi:MAG TPA: pyruvate kinase alpha/beta domain-containing protein [Myxococcota bacterium]|nr:pyruvate kinase alpha/beta domain-containing protein [Myxococcota bacterium]HRY96043.1 pyruvate kinase alpha/beta domain-containing protein [Myxococcota bacterium]HSA21859.1 pyruvate kinase alpha/beta domain-containing protein [Myxococcota bacterium]
MHLFEMAGEHNTQRTLELGRARALELGLRTALVATTSGATGELAVERLRPLRVVVVGHACGFAQKGAQELDPARAERIRAAEAQLLTATHAFGGVGRAVRRKLQTYQVDEIIAHTLRLFGQGTKVAVEIALMAADAGLLPMDQDALAIGGTSTGADTALVLSPAHSQDLFSLKIQEIVCKPRL